MRHLAVVLTRKQSLQYIQPDAMLPAEQMLRLTCVPAVHIQLHPAAVAGQRVVHSAHVALQHNGWALIRVDGRCKQADVLFSCTLPAGAGAHPC